jgi:hypothetical protein
MNALLIFLVAVFVVTWLFLAISIAVDSNCLFRKFRDKYPREAEKEMKEVFTGMRHPSKVIYFLTKDTQVFLAAQNDLNLLALRNRFVRMTWTLLSLHFGAMALGLVCAAILRWHSKA